MVKVYRPGSTVEQLYSLLCMEIMNGTLKPGQSLKEQELKARFGTSRAPIREAIRLLAADRLVIVNAYKKKYVRKITRDDLSEVIPVLACLEGCAAKLAINNITPQQLDDFVKINEKLKAAYQAGNIENCIDINFEFHKFYVKNASNETLKQAIRPIIQRVVKLWVTTLYTNNPVLFEKTINEHEKIINAFVKGDKNKVDNCAKSHIDSLLSRAMKLSVFDKQDNFNLPAQKQ